MGPGAGSAGGMQEWGLEAQGLWGEVEDRLYDFLDLPDFDDEDLDDKLLQERLHDRALPRDTD